MGEAFPGLPKALIPVGGKPVLQHQLELARAAGVESVTVFAGYLADKIADLAVLVCAATLAVALVSAADAA